MSKHLAILLASVFAPFRIFAAAANEIERPSPDLAAGQLLALHEQAQQKTYRSFISRIQMDTQGFLSHHNILQPGHRRSRYVVEVRTDGRRHYWSEEFSGQCYPTLAETTPAADPRIKWFLFDGRLYYTSGHEPMWRVNRAVQQRKAGQKLQALRNMLGVRISDEVDPISPFTLLCQYKPGQDALSLPPGIGTLEFVPDNFLIPKLKTNASARLEPNLETIEGTKCYVVKAALREIISQPKDMSYTNERVLRIHFSPDFDWNIVRFEETNTSRRVSERRYTMVTHSLVDKVRFEKINERWAPMEWQVTTQTRDLNSLFRQNTTNKVKRVQLLLNPDHEALGSFKPSFVKDGAAVRLEGLGNRYKTKTNLVWKANEAVDEDGKVALDLGTDMSK